MATIAAVTVGTPMCADDVIITLSNNTSICATRVADISEGLLVVYNNKLILIKEDKSCKLLREGVSIR